MARVNVSNLLNNLPYLNTNPLPDLNVNPKTGFYVSNAATQNNPGANACGIIHQNLGGASFQLAFHVINAGEVYFRQNIGSSYANWKKLH